MNFLDAITSLSESNVLVKEGEHSFQVYKDVYGGLQEMEKTKPFLQCDVIPLSNDPAETFDKLFILLFLENITGELEKVYNAKNRSFYDVYIFEPKVGIGEYKYITILETMVQEFKKSKDEQSTIQAGKEAYQFLTSGL